MHMMPVHLKYMGQKRKEDMLDKEKSAAQKLQERTKRIDDAANLKVPDRVPIVASFSYFPAKYTGITCEDAFFNSPKWIKACKKTILDFDPDLYVTEMGYPGNVFETLGARQLLVPGRGISPFHSHQYFEDEYMKADELDYFEKETADFTIRRYMPRIYSKLKAFHSLPPLVDALFGFPEIASFAMFARPDFKEAMKALEKAGEQASEWLKTLGDFGAEMEALGYPAYAGGVTLAPYDLLPDLLRGMRGSMLDMYRQKDKVLEVCENTLLPLCVTKGTLGAKERKNKKVFIPLHRGAEGFMSIKQFETFYWPTLKKLMLALIEAGLIPVPFFEGDYTSRLEYLLELPKARVIGHFDTTDIFKAKEIVGGHICIQGNMPASLLQSGTPQLVKEHTKKLIDFVGKDGGYIMSCRSSMDEADPKLVKVWIDYTKEYGVYR
jgi:hypothetical protein